MRIFLFSILAGWGLMFLMVALCLAFPRVVGSHFAPIAQYFVLLPLFLLVCSSLYGMISIYKAGMRRARR